jgi:DNA-binding CsgD family transcriptional regulator
MRVPIPSISLDDLPPRQRQVAEILLEDVPRKTMAKRLGISALTLDHHMERLFIKYHVDSRPALVRRIELLS